MATDKANYKSDDVFIFCWYPNGWLPRAVIAKISELNDHEFQQMNTIVNAGHLIENVLEKEYESERVMKIIKKGIILDNNKYIPYNSTNDNDKELFLMLSTWQNLSDNFYICAEITGDDNCYNHMYEYYINDKDSNLSPYDLYKKLLQLKYVPKSQKSDVSESDTYNIPINVKECVMYSDIPINFENDNKSYIKPLRFFFHTKDINKISNQDSNQSSDQDSNHSSDQDKREHIRIFIENTFDISNIMIADSVYNKDDSKDLFGYGYATPDTIEQWESLNGKTYKCYDTTLTFM